MVRISLIIALLAGTVASAQVTPFNYSIQKNVVGSNAAVVSAHTLASQAGLEILKQGGNAFDAAIATQLALAVVYPGAGNLGGGGFMVAHTADGRNIALDFRETAPSKATRDMYLDKNGNPITSLSMEGHLASGVPGTVAGLFATMKYAKLPFKTLIAPAIKLAEQGFVLTAWQAADFNGSRELFLKMNKNKIAFVRNNPWKEGDTLVQKELANTLKRIRDLGAKGFYEGATAKMIANEMKKGNGIISLADLKNYKAKEREAMQFYYKKNLIVTMPLPSSGGIILEQLLKMIEKRDIASLPFQSAESVQLMTEAERRAFADRAEFLGDPDFVKVPVSTLTSDRYLEERMKDFVPGKAGSSTITKYGNVHESEQTTHLSIVDEEGNAVSVTTTLNDHFGNKTVITGAGFIMNNEMDDFSVKPGVPNMYGAVGNEKNAIAPGKRMLSSMTPTIVISGVRPAIVVGTPGGTTIPTSVFQSLVNIIDYKMSPEDAVNKPKFHHQWQPDVIYVEKDFPADVRIKLEAMGYKLTEKSSIGRTELIKIDVTEPAKVVVEKEKNITARTKDKIKITAVADKRGDDDARGY
jgi:gamma-glutamyltranspeptidase/glutathione hydrolase